MDRTQFFCKDFGQAVYENMVIDENTINHTIKSKGLKLDGWYLAKQDYQPSIQDYTYKQVGQKLNYCPYCGTKFSIE